MHPLFKERLPKLSLSKLHSNSIVVVRLGTCDIIQHVPGRFIDCRRISQRKSECARFADAGYTYVNAADGIPGGKIGNAGLRKTENPLEYAYAFGGAWSIYTVHIQSRDSRIVLGNAV